MMMDSGVRRAPVRRARFLPTRARRACCRATGLRVLCRLGPRGVISHLLPVSGAKTVIIGFEKRTLVERMKCEPVVDTMGWIDALRNLGLVLMGPIRTEWVVFRREDEGFNPRTRPYVIDLV